MTEKRTQGAGKTDRSIKDSAANLSQRNVSTNIHSETLEKKYCGYSHVNTETPGRVIKTFGRAIAFISSLQKPGRMIEKLG